jgi:hypothetical protein
MKTAVEWFYDKVIQKIYRDIDCSLEDLLEQANEMEKNQMDKVAGDWWDEGASYMHDGGRKYESFEQYYNETFKQQEQ